MVNNIAHRGARSLAPENTLLSAEKAKQIGAHLWETDIQLTADGVPVLLHDRSLARTTDVEQVFPEGEPWFVDQFSLDEILRLDTGRRFIQDDPFDQIKAGALSPGELIEMTCVPIPTLLQALDVTSQLDWKVILELKRHPKLDNSGALTQAVLESISESNITHDQVVISSFDHDIIRTIQAERPELDIQALVHFLDLDADAEPEFSTYNVWSRVNSAEDVARAVSIGVEINVYTVNDVDQMRRYIDAGASGLFTDFPQRLAQIQETGSGIM